MNINGKPLAECPDQELRQALTALVAVIGADELAQVRSIVAELERRARLAAVVKTLTESKR